MLKGQDMLVLAALLGREGPPATYRELGSRLGLSPSAVHRSVHALRDAQLVDESQHPQLAQVDEFLTHSVRYVFPPRMRGEVRGIATAWAAPPLRDLLAETGGIPPVWADPQGDVRGIDFEPLHPSAPEIARRDRVLGERLALIDALRLNDARIRELARSELHKHFRAASAV
jgi:DNA-binding transcriptional ArsR family regulator